MRSTDLAFMLKKTAIGPQIFTQSFELTFTKTMTIIILRVQMLFFVLENPKSLAYFVMFLRVRK